MLQLNAQVLREKREELFTKFLIEDYSNNIKQIEDFFNDENNLLLEFPQIVIKPRLSITTIKLKEELITNGFIVQTTDENKLTISLYEKSAYDVIEPNVEKVETVKVEPTPTTLVQEQPKVVIKTPAYNHTDLQMSGGDPF